MAVSATSGLSLISPNAGARSGQLIGIDNAEKTLANLGVVDLWVDTKSVKERSNTILFDRRANVPGTIDGAVGRARSTSSKDTVGFTWSDLGDGQRLSFPSYSLPDTYMMTFVLNPTDAGTTSIRALAYENPTGEYLASWLSQASAGAALDLRWRHGSSGGFSLTNAIPVGVRSTLSVHYDNPRGRLSAFLGQTLIGTIDENVKPASTGLWLGGRPGTGTPTHHFYGMMEAVIVSTGEMYSTDAAAAANTRRSALIQSISDIYG